MKRSVEGLGVRQVLDDRQVGRQATVRSEKMPNFQDSKALFHPHDLSQKPSSRATELHSFTHVVLELESRRVQERGSSTPAKERC